jgi:hypothetical protein
MENGNTREETYGYTRKLQNQDLFCQIAIQGTGR